MLTNVTKPMNAIAMLLVQIMLDLMIVNAGLGLGVMEEFHVVVSKINCCNQAKRILIIFLFFVKVN